MILPTGRRRPITLTGCCHADLNPNAGAILQALGTGRVWIEGPNMTEAVSDEWSRVCEDVLRRVVG